MNFDLFMFALAISAGAVALLIAVFAYLFHRREFWKIKDWDKYRRDQKTVEGIQSLIETRKKEQSILEEQIKSISEELSKAQEIIRQAEVCKDFLAQKPGWESQRDALNKSLEDARQKYADYQKNLAEVSAQAGTLRQEVAELEAKKKFLEKEIEQLPALKAEKEKLEKEKQDLNNALSDLKKMEIKLDQEIKDKQGNLEQVKGECKEAEKRRDEAQKAEATARTNEQDAREKVESLKKHEKILEDSITSLKKLFEGIKKARQDTVEITAEAFSGLYKPVIESHNQAPIANANETVLLQGLKNHVQEREFNFSERLLYAFHTALKTSDISCLTVMAGVSGTGKSALPKLYAEAMGMHFVLLAVEPRWDSPRDLFGFFNYMENRYEPTALARSLVQFDEHGLQGNDLNGQMLMVLLDEMNLARIEYYFSEYLSKLELRRELTDQIRGPNSDGYRKVSMELFAGREANNEKPIRLFAGSNILFVGTMNEDETTQSLSDKVIDRANVIHFSRPTKLQNKSNAVAKNHIAEGPVGFQLWTDWRRPANETDDSIRPHAERLEKLNTLLGGIGRPFAHRTYQAILSYIANYPLENMRPRALADQIAMRVMPKLRGLDLDQHKAELQGVGSAIRDLDPALSNAYESAMNTKQGFFRWQGIDWNET